MISEDVKYKFDQILTGLLAFMANIEIKLQEVVPNIPVYILQTGDSSYRMDEKFEKYFPKKIEDIYQKTPRFVVNVQAEDIQFKTEEDTNKYNNFQYNYDNENYIASVARKCLIIPVVCDLVSPNFIKALENFEAFAPIVTYSNVFTYDWSGSTFEAAYALSSNSGERAPMDSGSNSRNSINIFSLELQIHIMVPKIKSIRKLTDLTTEINLTELNDDKTISSQHNINSNT